MNISNYIQKISTNTKLNEKEQRELNDNIKSLNEMGIAPNGSFTYQRKELRGTIIAKNMGVETHTQTNTQNDILAQVTYYTNLKNNIRLPNTKNINAEWKSEGYAPNENAVIDGVELAPNRLVSVVNVSNTIEVTSKEFTTTLTQLIQDECANMLIKTMFSQASADNGQNKHSKGLFYVSSTYTPNQVFEAMESVTNKGYNGTFIFSPSLYKEVLTNFAQYFVDGKFIGFNYIVDGRVEKDFGAFVDLSKVGVADWTYNSVTIDNVTKIKDGIVCYIVETFADFGMMNNQAIAVIKKANE